jgi:hypothetical protein
MVLGGVLGLMLIIVLVRYILLSQVHEKMYFMAL